MKEIILSEFCCKKKFVKFSSWASICNNAGSTAGVLVGNSLFLILESESFSNNYIRPFFGLERFMHFFGLVFIVSTTLILFFKSEKNFYQEESLDNNFSIKETFSLLNKILKLDPIKSLLIILFTSKIAFATSSIRILKMIEAGVPKETLGLLNGFFQFIQILTPILASKFFDLDRPLEAFLKIYPIRIVFTLLLAIWVYITPQFRSVNDGGYTFQYFFLYMILNTVYCLIFSSMALFKTAFFTEISDKNIGGTYMTLLNTIANIGLQWPTTLALYLVDALSIKACVFEKKPNLKTISNKKFFNDFLKTMHENTCISQFEQKNCQSYGAECIVQTDAFYFLTAICAVLGVIWMHKFKKPILNLQSLSKLDWRIIQVKNNQCEAFMRRINN
ncbi:acetyl-coenzyme A transporter 1 [Brachionus plicatilis]|uniref:Acetyl-coenzyme A transporter 1 n=1 Tax=Brachionus plicatilis TaxID=10195 RepID=A0A3M7Q3E7_BRAPC|nr:acetyl-coenzyme A transporter 1 [Brachionus plicatilis]